MTFPQWYTRYRQCHPFRSTLALAHTWAFLFLMVYLLRFVFSFDMNTLLMGIGISTAIVKVVPCFTNPDEFSSVSELMGKS